MKVMLRPCDFRSTHGGAGGRRNRTGRSSGGREWFDGCVWRSCDRFSLHLEHPRSAAATSDVNFFSNTIVQGGGEGVKGCSGGRGIGDRHKRYLLHFRNPFSHI